MRPAAPLGKGHLGRPNESDALCHPELEHQLLDILVEVGLAHHAVLQTFDDYHVTVCKVIGGVCEAVVGLPVMGWVCGSQWLLFIVVKGSYNWKGPF